MVMDYVGNLKEHISILEKSSSNQLLVCFALFLDVGFGLTWSFLALTQTLFHVQFEAKHFVLVLSCIVFTAIRKDPRAPAFIGSPL